MSTAPRVFISYSHKDEAWKDRLVTQLKVLEYEGHFVSWDDRQIGAGATWEAEITAQLNQATVAVLLISADYLASEIPRLLQRRSSESLRVIPLVVRPCAWREVAWLAGIQCYPRDGRPLASMREHVADEALATLAVNIRRLVKSAASAAEPASAPAASSAASHTLPERITILFLAANPVNASRLALAEEVRDIGAKIMASEFGNRIDFQTRWSARATDLLQALNETRPAVVHFSGHGGDAALYFEGDDGMAQAVSGAALKQVFKAFKDTVRLVVLSACFADKQARALTSVIPCALGMSGAISDRAARVFSASFYRAIGFGRSIHNAFEQGVAELMVEGIPEETKPKLMTRRGIDADLLYLFATNRAHAERAPRASARPRRRITRTRAARRHDLGQHLDIGALGGPTPSAVRPTADLAAPSATRDSAPPPERVTMLFLAARPKSAGPIGVKEELAAIKMAVRGAPLGERINLAVRMGVRPRDLLPALHETRPTIVHFVGHANGASLVFEGDSAMGRPVGGSALKRVLMEFQDSVRLVVLNASDTAGLARVVTKIVPCAIGMAGALSDGAACVFTGSFYRAITFGGSVRRAFQAGVTALSVEGLAADAKPRLLTRADVNPSTMYLL